jgi:hypothetical protein
MVKQRQQKQVYNSWIGKSSLSIGKPLGNNKPVNFFKTNSKNIPVNMFKDNDRDGVANVFDCKPNNPNKQGFIDAVIGAVKGIASGGVKAGWQSGIAKEGNPITRHPRVAENKIYKDMKKRSEDRVYSQEKMVGLSHAIQMEKFMNEANAKSAAEEADKKIQDKHNQKIYTDNRVQLNQREFARKHPVLSKVTKGMDSAVAYADKNVSPTGTGYMNKGMSAILKGVTRASPTYSMAMEFRADAIKKLKKEIQDPTLTRKQRAKKFRQLERKVVVQKQNKYMLDLNSRKDAEKTLKRTITSIYPQVYAMSGQHVLGAPGQRGRPRGSLDERYRAYGGVMGYRAYKSRMLKQQKQLLRTQIEAQLAAKRKQMPNYERVQYQVPQEVQGATPEFSQFPQYQEQPQTQIQSMPEQPQGYPEQYPEPQPQYPQNQPQQYPQQYPQQQYPPQPQQRPIATVFKSSGGSPYPPVNRQSLASPRQTIPMGYVEAVDSFTGRRYLKALPKKEGWV